MHSGAYLQSAGRLELSYDRSSDRISLRNHSEKIPYTYRLDKNFAQEAATAGMVKTSVESLNQTIAKFSGNSFNDIACTVAVSDFSLDRYQAGSETSIGNFITDAMRIEVEKITGRRVDIAMHANGIIRGGLHPATSANVRGNLSLYDLITVSSLGSGKDGQPGYGLVSFFLTEKEVINLLEISTLLPILWNDIYFLQFSGLRYQVDPQRAYWLWLPIIDKPLPAYRSILAAELYTGPGIQNQESFRQIDPEGTGLCHVVTTHYMASYLPMVGEKLPRLNIILKNAEGKPVDLDQTIIKIDNREFKLWEATLRYVAGFSTDNAEGQPGLLPEYYRSTGSRIIKVKGQSLWLWPGLGLVCLLIIVALFLLLRLRKSKEQSSPLL
jgi:UDP-sugar diphosphatase